jgi:hypothetical protein
MSPALKAQLLLQARTNVSRAALLGLTVAEWRALGDVPGHEFHGNQWTSGGGTPIAESALKEKGFYLEDYQKIWVKEGLVDLVELPIKDTYQHEYDNQIGKTTGQGGIQKDDPTVVKMQEDWRQGYRLPVIEVHKTEKGYKISDGQHRMVAYSRDHATIPALVTRDRTSEHRKTEVAKMFRVESARALGGPGSGWTAENGHVPGAASRVGQVVAKSKYGEIHVVKSGDEIRYQAYRKNGENLGTYKKVDSAKDALRSPANKESFPSGYRSPDVAWKHLAAATSSRDATSVHRAADKHLTPMRLAVQAAFNIGRKALGKPPNANRAAAAVKSALLKVLPVVLRQAFVAGGNAGIGLLPKRRVASMRTLDKTFNIRFDVSNPAAIKWAAEHAAELAKNLSDTSRDDIKAAIAGALEGEDPYDAILSAVGDSDRADLIARNEVMTAANEGNRASMDAAVEAGLLPANAQVEWIGTSDMCDDCAELDGTTRDIDGEYDGDGGDGPPLHVNCRCTEGVSAEGEA